MSGISRDELQAQDEVPGFALAQFVYDVQVQQLDRSSQNAQSLLTALALLAAFSSPLVLGEDVDGWVGVLLAGGLLAFITCVAVAAYWTLRIMYVRRTARAKLGEGRAPAGFLYFADINSFATADQFAAHCGSLSDHDQMREMFAQSWQMAQLVGSKSHATVQAVQWTLAALLLFLAVLVIRYAGVNL